MSFADFSFHLLYSSEDTFPSSWGDARTTGATSSSIHLLHSLFKGHVAAVCSRLSMTHSEEKACPGKASRLWALATCRTQPEASTIFQKDYQSAVWVFRKWKITRNSLSVSEQTNSRSNHQLNSWLNQVHSLVLLVTRGVSVGSP